MKHRQTIFHALVEDCGLQETPARTRYTELVFLHPVGSVGHIVHSCVSRALNIDALFFMLRWNRYGLPKTDLRKHYF
jgi:hypothetical protein